jgi:thiol-disulfide isomerase/thioredoxin
MNIGTRRRLLTWIPIFTIFVGVYFVLSLPSVQEFLIVRSAPPLKQSMELDGMRLPASIEFTLLDGTIVTGASLRGRPVVINLFATWCSPCVAEVPSLERLRGVVESEATVLMVGLDSPLELSAWNAQRNGDPQAFATPNPPGPPGPPLTTGALPMTIVVDPSGVVVAKVTGAFRWDDASVIDVINKLAH